MRDSPLIEAARQWVIEKYPYNSHHLIKALEWLDRIAPDASEAVRLATLTHDMERAFPGPDQPVLEKIDGGRIEEAYNVLHSERSARFVGEWLRERGVDEAFVEEVEKLIKVHEVGGWLEANLVQAADSLSFLETNIDLFLNMARTGKRTLNEVMIKFYTTLHRIQVNYARELALPMYEEAKKRAEKCWEELLGKTNSVDNYLALMLFDPQPLQIFQLTSDIRSHLVLVKSYVDRLLEEDASGKLPGDNFRTFLVTIKSAVTEAESMLTAALDYDRLHRLHETHQEKQSQ
jgi:hypothetical protein